MAFDRTRTLRGAWRAPPRRRSGPPQQPLDKQVFGVDYDDVELLGRLVRLRAPATRPGGLAIHLVNGALVGAAYANLAPSLPRPRALRGPRSGSPSTSALAADRGDRPARPRPPHACGATPRAFAQATWRHLLFGVVLGELERRLNPPETELEPVGAEVVASNGHGSPEHLVATGP